MVLSTLDSPLSSDVGFNAPNFGIRISTGAVPLGVRQLVQRLEYESTDGMADLLRVNLVDPDMIQAPGAVGGHSQRISDTKIFQPGNEISVSLGYGSELKHVGRAIIRKTRPTFPRAGLPTVEVIAYTKDCLMMDNAPEGSKKKKGKGGRRFTDQRFSDAVRERADDYDFVQDIDETPDARHTFYQKVGLSDYDFVNGLSNLSGYIFWVDGDENGVWTLHFKNPDKLSAADLQAKIFTFRYNDGNLSSLLTFEPELAIQGAITKLKVQVKDPVTGKTLEAEFTEENDRAPDPKVVVSEDTLRAVDNILDGEQSTGSDIKLFINDFSFEEHANRRFRTEAEVIAWARQWFRRQRENFVLARGVTIGVEDLMSRQTHAISGVSVGLSGDYYFTRVKHILDSAQGYLCDFNARKVVPTLP